MTDPVASIPAFVVPAFVDRAAPVAPVAAVSSGSSGADPQPQREPPAPKPVRPPLDVEVAKADDGVFVYTLRDPATDTVLAVIPREAVRLDRDGRNLDQRV